MWLVDFPPCLPPCFLDARDLDRTLEVDVLIAASRVLVLHTMLDLFLLLGIFLVEEEHHGPMCRTMQSKVLVKPADRPSLFPRVDGDLRASLNIEVFPGSEPAEPSPRPLR